MSEAQFWAFHKQFMEPYYAKDYEKALEILERGYRNFPDQPNEIAYSRLCMYSVAGKQAEALSIFQEALDTGYWFDPVWMEHDPDLIELKPLPRFQEMFEICCQRLKSAQADSHPELFVAQPARPAKLQPLLLAFHGNPGNGKGTIEEWKTVTAQGWLLAAPQSSHATRQDGYSWTSRESAAHEIGEHLTTLQREYPIDPQCMVLGGFSTGGGQAIWMALHQSIQACGFIVLAPHLTEEELAACAALLDTHKAIGLRGYILVGDADPDFLETSRKIADLLNASDIPCLFEVHPGLDHYYPEDFAAYVSKGLAFINPY